MGALYDEMSAGTKDQFVKDKAVKVLEDSGLFTKELLEMAKMDVMVTFADPVMREDGIFVKRLVGWRPSAVEALTGYDRKQIQIECNSGKIEAGRMGGSGDAGWHIIPAASVIALKERRNAYEQRRANR